ncbi:MAG: hypothetical protein IIZ09_09315 [Ruminococcus sp.]|nr:hypothetical protein [Ruminococcus sp.]
MINYINVGGYADHAELFAAIVGTANFWDETTETSATVGDITITDTSTISPKFTLSCGDYNFDITAASTSIGNTIIATTENSLLVAWGAPSGSLTNFFAIGKGTNDKWGAVKGAATNVSNVICPDTGGNSAQSITNAVSPLEQLIPLAALNANFVFDEIFQCIKSVNQNYDGKMELNGQKFVRTHALALAYTD